MDTKIVTRTNLTCPGCGFVDELDIPLDYWQAFHTCTSCDAMVRPLSGYCCVFCSYGNHHCIDKHEEVLRKVRDGRVLPGCHRRWARRIAGRLVPLFSIERLLLTNRTSVEFVIATAAYFVAIIAVYMAAHYFLGEHLFARANPWIGTLVLVDPPTMAFILGLRPSAFQLALALYISIFLIFNFMMS